MSSSRPVSVAILAISLLVGVGAMVSHARQGDDPGAGESAFGNVDLLKVYEASDAPQQFAQEAAQIETDAQNRVDAVAGLGQLSEAELKEFGDLIGLKNPDAKQKVRMDELKMFNDQRAGHLRDVQQKPDAALTPEDKKLMAAAAVQRRQFDNMMRLMQQDVRQQVLDREEQVKRGLVAQLRQEVSKVAKEKKIMHVFDVTAMVSSTNDITSAVIQKVSKKGVK